MNTSSPEEPSTPAASSADLAPTSADPAVPGRPNPIRRLYDWVLGWADHRWALPALFVLAFTEAIFFPIPPDVLLIALVLGARKRWAFLALVCSAGSVLGGVAGYYIGYLASDLATSIVKFYGLMEQQTVVQNWLSENAFVAIWSAGFTPIPYKVFTVTAGLCHDTIGVGTLFAASVTSRPLRFFLVAVLLFWFGPAAKRFIDRYFNLLTIGLAVAVILGFVFIGRVLH